MSFPSKAYGSFTTIQEGGFDAPVELPPGSHVLTDGQVVSVLGDSDLTRCRGTSFLQSAGIPKGDL